MSSAQAQGAELLRAAHRPGNPLVLPNAWDCASAQSFADLGYPVVGTSSGAVAASHGYGDHQQAPAEIMIAAIARIVSSVSVPVTADLEAGYELEAAELAERVIATGAAGMNLEDADHATGTLRAADQQAAYLSGVRRQADVAGVRLVINARIDSFIEGRGLGECIDRAATYLAAGADSVFPLGLFNEADIARFVEEVDGPVSILRWAKTPTRSRLAELGVARISFGSFLQRGALDAAQRIVGAPGQPGEGDLR